MKRLNGWQRLGVIASVLWFVGGGLWGNYLAIQDMGAFAINQLKICISQQNHNYTECGIEFQSTFSRDIQGHWWFALGFAAGPIALGWLLAWAGVALVRWVIAGFAESHDRSFQRPHRLKWRSAPFWFR